VGAGCGGCESRIMLGALESGRECVLVMWMKSCVLWEAMFMLLPESSGAWERGGGVWRPLGARQAVINYSGG
jgi:hypothetical protein